MISMTGFSCREKAGSDFSFAIEIKGLNSRFLEINVNLPPWLSVLEPKIRECISQECGRGKVDVYLRVKDNDTPISVTVNTEAARAYQEAIADLASALNIREEPSLSLLLGMEGVIQTEKNRDSLQYWQEIEPVLKEALQDFVQEKLREGECTRDDILKSIGRIDKSLEVVASFTDVLEGSIKSNIKARFAELVGEAIDENRVLTETAALLVKCTIAEEIARLKSHLAEFRAETERNPRAGKKLDFLCQEINREVNTIGSKSSILEVSREVVEMKEALENVREQLRNVE
jgi:uncharacterized protein (TIGR00255 family)